MVNYDVSMIIELKNKVSMKFLIKKDHQLKRIITKEIKTKNKEKIGGKIFLDNQSDSEEKESKQGIFLKKRIKTFNKKKLC